MNVNLIGETSGKAMMTDKKQDNVISIRLDLNAVYSKHWAKLSTNDDLKMI